MKSRLCLALSVSVAGCASPAPLPPPSPPPPPPPASIGVDFRYEEPLTLVVTTNGAPYDGDVALVPGSGDVAGAPLPAGAMKLVARGGMVKLDRKQVAHWEHGALPRVVVDGRQLDIPQLEGTSVFRCASAIGALSDIAPCSQGLPGGEVLPAHCDAAGTAVWKAKLAQKTVEADACWTSTDDDSLAKIEAAHDPLVRARGCARMYELAGPEPADDMLLRLSKPCPSSAPPALAQRSLKLRRMHDLPDAYEKAKDGTSQDMRRFWATYKVTGDPRVEEIRALAQKRFGPKDVKKFLALREDVAKMAPAASGTGLSGIGRGNDGRIQLCSWTGGVATVSVARCSLPGLRSGSCGAPAFPRNEVMLPPDPKLVAKIVALVRQRTGARVETTDGCAADHWYLDAR